MSTLGVARSRVSLAEQVLAECSGPDSVDQADQEQAASHALIDAQAALIAALTERDQTFSDAVQRLYEPFGDYATSWTCGEAEQVAGMLRLVGIDPANFLEMHAEGDEEGDQHWVGVA